MLNLPKIDSVSKFRTFLKFLSHKIFNKYFENFLHKKAIKKGRVLYQSLLGFKMDLKLDRVVDRGIYVGSFEKETLLFFKNSIKPNMTIFDIGANVGLFSLTASAVLKNSGQIYAFEPAEEVYSDFQKNIALNNFQNIQLIQTGVSEKSGEITFNICEDNAYNSINSKPMRKVIRKITIPTTTIDDFCKQEKIHQIDIIKVDTEGAEYFILKGGKNILSKDNAPILFLEYNTQILKEVELSDIRNLLKDFGYSLYELRFGILKPFDPLLSSTCDIICLKTNHKLN